jgi:hypothetical protein
MYELCANSNRISYDKHIIFYVWDGIPVADWFNILSTIDAITYNIIIVLLKIISNIIYYLADFEMNLVKKNYFLNLDKKRKS